jgi:hypothetical protein
MRPPVGVSEFSIDLRPRFGNTFCSRMPSKRVVGRRLAPLRLLLLVDNELELAELGLPGRVHHLT